MRLVVQRCKEASVTVDGKQTGAIDHGLLLLVGITHEDTVSDVKFLADKVSTLRIFDDQEGKMNLSIHEVKGDILSVSQFTLYGDCRKGRRPNYMKAAKPDQALELYQLFNEALCAAGLRVETGIFGAMMEVRLLNDGPVTLILDSTN